jgi:hypothetical protein
MSDGKNIEIKIAVTGGDQAAAEVRKVEQAAQTLETSGGESQALGGMLEGIPEQADEAATSVKKLGESAAETGKQFEDAGPKLDRIANIQKAEVLNGLAQAAGQLGERVRQAAGEFEGAEPQFRKTLEGIAEGLDATTGALSGAAQGFAVGGPFGAAIGALVGGVMPEFKEALDDMVSSLANESEAKARAAEMAQKLAEMQRMGVDAYYAAADASEELKRITDDTTESIDAQKEALESRNRVLAAEDRAAAATRDREDAARIAAGEAPEKVKADRASFDAQKERERMTREEEAGRAGIQEAYDAAQAAKGEAAKVSAAENATPEQIAEAEKAAKELEAKFQKLQKDYQELVAINRARRVETSEREKGKIEAAGRQYQERQTRERTRAEADAGREAQSLIPKEASQQLRGAIEKVTKGLRDGDQGGEVKLLISLMNQLAATVGSTNSSLKGEIQELRSKLDALEGNVKNRRSK